MLDNKSNSGLGVLDIILIVNIILKEVNIINWS